MSGVGDIEFGEALVGTVYIVVDGELGRNHNYIFFGSRGIEVANFGVDILDWQEFPANGKAKDKPGQAANRDDDCQDNKSTIDFAHLRI